MTVTRRVCLAVALLAALGLEGCTTDSSNVRRGSDRRAGRRPAARQQLEPMPPGESAPEEEEPAEAASRDDASLGEELAREGEAEPAEPAAGGERPAAPEAAAAGRRRAPSTPDEVLEDLKQSDVAQLADAEYHEKLGDTAYEALDYAGAVEEYRLALQLNPALSGARERLGRASLVLGLRSGEVLAIQKEFAEADRVSKEERLADARQGVKEGTDLLQRFQESHDERDLENAERKLRKVYEELLWFEYPEDMTTLREEVKTRIEEAQALKREVEKQKRSRQEELVSRASVEALEQEQRIREERVRGLVRKATDYIRIKDYSKAIDACEAILLLKPDHRLARFWLREVKRQQLDHRKLVLMRDDRENRQLTREEIERSAIPTEDYFNFPSEQDWNIVRHRREGVAEVTITDPDWVRKIKNTLETEKMTFNFEQKPLADVLAFVSQITGITVVTDPAINTQELQVDLAAKEMRALDALNQVMIITNLAYTFKENTLYITEKDKARGTAYFHIYNVSDILNKIRDFQGPELKLRSADDQEGSGQGTSSVTFTQGGAESEEPIDPNVLIELIREASGGEERWGEQNTIEYHKGQLLVNATPEIHGAIQSTLENLRQDSDLFVVLEARFIDVKEDFLEDIGVDSRALGTGNNFGNPFGTVINNSQTGGQDPGFMRQGSPVRDVTLIMGQDRWAGRMQHIVDGFTGLVSGTNLRGGQGRFSGLTLQATWLEPFQLNVIVRAVQETSDVRELTAPIVTAHNGQRVYVSVITQRAYIADYELVSGGTGFVIIEVADPVVQTFQEGVILDVDPVISPDKKYITLDVRPTLANLIGGVISTIRISLGSFTNVAFQVPIGVPEVSLQQSFTSVTVPNGGTVLLGGFKSLSDSKFVSYLPILGKIPLVKNLFRRKAEVVEKRSLVILVTARIVDLRTDERNRYNE